MVGLLAATLNVVAERGATLVADAWHAPAPAVLPDTPVPVASPSSAPDKIAAQITSLPAADELILSATDFERAILGRSLAGPADATVLRARTQLARNGTTLGVQVGRAGYPAQRRALAARVARVTEAGAGALNAADAREAAALAYESQLGTLLRAVDLVGSDALTGKAQQLHAAASRLGGSGYSMRDLDAVAAAEREIEALLLADQRSPVPMLPDRVVDPVRAELAAVRSARARLVSQGQIFLANTVQLRQAVKDLGARAADWNALRARIAAQLVVATLPTPEAIATEQRLAAEHAALLAARAAAETQRRVAQQQLAEQQARRLQRLIAWITTGLLAASLLICIATVRSITRPVRDLMRATARLAAGESGVEVKGGGARELDALAVSFNVMATEVDAARRTTLRYQAELEQRVAERTQQLRHQAEHDPLTSLPNRRQLFDRLGAAITDARGTSRLVAVYFLDLDNFKTINDSTGHEFGDALLRACAQRLAGLVANVGFVARFGGDEFAVVATQFSDTASVCAFGDSLVHSFTEALRVDGRETVVSVTVGASLFPDHHDTPEALLRAADTALYRAKSQGRNRFALYTPELLAAAAARFSTEQQLRRAVDAGELSLVFQPELRIGDLRVDLVESLLRWRRPDGEVVEPERFLRIAEESGLITEISHWSMEAALAAVAEWRRQAWPDARVAINVSPQQLFDHRFSQRLQRMLDAYHLQPDAVEIELTESVLQTGQTTLTALRRLRELGVSVALDDFGTGYSSLASLDQLPINRVKLDRALVGEVDRTSRANAIVSATIHLCHELGLEVTAEGVERPAQLTALLRYQPILLQGFLIAHPVAQNEVPEAVARTPQNAQRLFQDAGVDMDLASVINLFPSTRQRSK